MLNVFQEKKKEMEDELKNKMDENMIEILSEVYTSRQQSLSNYITINIRVTCLFLIFATIYLLNQD